MYEYKVTQFNPDTDEGGLFVGCINSFLKLKAEASGYPDWVRSSEDEERYFETFWESEGIRLDKDSIRDNAAKRGLAKLCIKSMRGKLTERNDRTQTKVIPGRKNSTDFWQRQGPRFRISCLPLMTSTGCHGSMRERNTCQTYDIRIRS